MQSVQRTERTRAPTKGIEGCWLQKTHLRSSFIPNYSKLWDNTALEDPGITLGKGHLPAEGTMSSNANLLILSALRSLLITSNDGSLDNQYRIHHRHVEFRAVAPGGPPRSDRAWRTLDDDELQLHFALRTPVADWLEKNVYARMS